MKRLIIISSLLLSVVVCFSQTYITRTGHINIKSANKVQNIVADNYQVGCTMNASTGEFKIIALIKSFEYQFGAVNKVMNTKEINVSEFPKITYDGKIINIKQVNFNKPGNYPVKFKGTLYIWDEKRITDADGTLTVLADGTVEGKANFGIVIEDANVKKIDGIMKQKLPSAINVKTGTFGVSKTIQVKAVAQLKKQK